MKQYNVEKIMVSSSDVDLASLRKELGHGQVVEHADNGETKEAIAYIALSPDSSQYAITSGVVDETLIDQDTSARDLVQAIIDAHNKSASVLAETKKNRIVECRGKTNKKTTEKFPDYFETDDIYEAIGSAVLWQVRAANPSMYRQAGLKVRIATTNYDVGDALTVYSDAPTNTIIHEADTDANISAYYNELIQEKVIPFDLEKELNDTEYFDGKDAIEQE